ncbi:MAG: hypothetical protein JNL75_10100 [Chitinophagales bacterium]|nr:hypothetical protein [Chitinophagales bacterium]
MKSSPKLFLSLFPGFIAGMMFQYQFNQNPSEIKTSEKMPRIDKDLVDQSCQRYIDAGKIESNQKVYGATFSRDEVIQLINGATKDIYVRIGFDNKKQTLFIGNDADSYITPSEGYCPTHCPFNN